jgi:hypothetical protein
VLQEVDRIGWLDRVVLALVRFHQKRDHFAPVGLGQAAGCLPEHFDFPERHLVHALVPAHGAVDRRGRVAGCAAVALAREEIV